MSAEARLREALRELLGDETWFADPQDDRRVVLEERLDDVLIVLKRGEWLITGGIILPVYSAHPANGRFTDVNWEVRIAQGQV